MSMRAQEDLRAIIAVGQRSNNVDAGRHHALFRGISLQRILAKVAFIVVHVILKSWEVSKSARGEKDGKLPQSRAEHYWKETELKCKQRNEEDEYEEKEWEAVAM